MSTALYEKDAASRLRAQMRRKAISLYYNSRGPKMSIEDVAKKMQLPQKYIKKWIQRYEKIGLHGYVGQRQSAILCIYKKNPNITLSQLRVLLRKVGIILSNSELSNILKSLKHILTDPDFMSASEDEILKKLEKVTKVQPKSIIKMNEKMCKEQTRDNSEHSYALPVKSIFQDHNYVANPELFYEEDDYSIYESVNKLVKYKNDLMSKIATVSKSLDKLFAETAAEKTENSKKDSKHFKISLLREQLLYLCLEMKGPRVNYEDIIMNLPVSEALVAKWIDQAKNIKRFVHTKHVNKCCGKIQETIVRLKKLNSLLTVEQIRNILHQVNIDLSRLKLERQLNSVRYMINGPEDFTEREFEEMSISEDDIDYGIKLLSMKIASANLKKEKHKNNTHIVENSNNQLSIQKIVELSSLRRNCKAVHFKDSSFENNSHQELEKCLKSNKNFSENKIEMVRHELQEELAKILNNKEKEKRISNKLINSEILNHKKNDTKINKAVNKINGLTFPKTINSSELSPVCNITKETNNKHVNFAATENKLANSNVKQDTAKQQCDDKVEKSNISNCIRFLKYFSLTPNDAQNGNSSKSEHIHQSEHLEIKENSCGNSSPKYAISSRDTVDINDSEKTNISNNISHILENKNNEVTMSLSNQLTVTQPHSNYNKLNEDNHNDTHFDKVDQYFKDQNLVTPTNTLESKDENDVNKEIITIAAQKCNLENIVEIVDEELVQENLTFCAKKEENFNENMANNNQPISSNESSNYKERKRKYSENYDIECEFEPIEDILMKEETDKKEIMTEYIECEDNSVVIKYWLAN